MLLAEVLVEEELRGRKNRRNAALIIIIKMALKKDLKKEKGGL